MFIILFQYRLLNVNNITGLSNDIVSHLVFI